MSTAFNFKAVRSRFGFSIRADRAPGQSNEGDDFNGASLLFNLAGGGTNEQAERLASRMQENIEGIQLIPSS